MTGLCLCHWALDRLPRFFTGLSVKRVKRRGRHAPSALNVRSPAAHALRPLDLTPISD
jgi:hypothetical protein